MSIFGPNHPVGVPPSGGRKFNDSPVIITVWAEEKGALSAGANEWAFGDGASGPGFGYVMMAPGRILRMGIAARIKTPRGGGGSVTPTIATVNITVNGEVDNLYGVTKQAGDHTYGMDDGSTITFTSPLEVAQGDIISFRSATNTPTSATCVCLLIELDM